MTQDTSMTIKEKREAIMDMTGVGHATVAQMTPAEIEAAWLKLTQEAEQSSPATRAATPRPATRRYKGGSVQKRPQMMAGGMYKGKKHAYAAGGYVNKLKIMNK